MSELWPDSIRQADEALERGEYTLAEELLRSCLSAGVPSDCNRFFAAAELSTVYQKLERALLAQGKDHEANVAGQALALLVTQTSPVLLAAIEEHLGRDSVLLAGLQHH